MRISLYYPFALTELTSYRKTDDYEASGEVLLSFEDSAHCVVTLRIDRRALAALIQRLQSEPDPPE